MGGLAPGIGGLELIVIALVALLVVGPRDLPLLMRKVGKAMGKARAMANDFRASFDEMARQSELDELRKEVEALRTGQMIPLGDEADKAFKDIRDDLNRPLDAPTLPAPASSSAGSEPAPDPAPQSEPEPEAVPAAPRARKAQAKPRATATSRKTRKPAS